MKSLWILLLCLPACVFGTQLTPSPIRPTPVPEGWQFIAPGLELRSDGPSHTSLDRLWILRIDPNHYRFRVHYQPSLPQRLDVWQEALDSPAAIINAGFFTPDFEAIGLLVSDGSAYGSAMRDRGGTFVVRGGQPRILSNVFEPDLGNNLEQAIQTFPLLLYSGERLYRASAQEQVTRRSVIAQDSQGRVLLMATPLLGLTLDALTQFLLDSDLDIVDALNLDGGGSTMLYVRMESTPLELPSLDSVPAVLAVYPR